MESWQTYSNDRQSRYNASQQGTPQQPQQSREFNSGGLHSNPPGGFNYEAYQPASNSTSRPGSMAVSPAATPNTRGLENDKDFDVQMQDADPYNRSKYASSSGPANHQAQPPGGRAGSQYLATAEESAAAQRYSPMNLTSPTSPYAGTPQQAQSSGPYASYSQGHRQSPSRSSKYQSASSLNYYNSQTGSPVRSAPQSAVLPTMNPLSPSSTTARGGLPPGQSLQGNDPSDSRQFPQSATVPSTPQFGQELKSQRPGSQQPQTPRSDSVPKFQKLKSVNELQPKINAQPAMRRANPEGGFISVSKNHRMCAAEH
jgi:dual specificity protein kinase YAK1